MVQIKKFVEKIKTKSNNIFYSYENRSNLSCLMISCKKTVGICLSVLVTTKLFRISDTLIQNASAAEVPVSGMSDKLLPDNTTQLISTDELTPFDYRRSVTSVTSVTSVDSPFHFHVFSSKYDFEEVQMVTSEMFQRVFKLNFLEENKVMKAFQQWFFSFLGIALGGGVILGICSVYNRFYVGKVTKPK